MRKILSFCKKSVLFYTIVYTIFFIMFKYACNQLFGIEYRCWVYLVASACIGIGIFVGIIQIICLIPKKVRVIKLILNTVFVLAVLYISPIILLGFAFAYTPEHHVEKNGEKYIASVYAFLRVRVEYQKDVSFCFKGYKVEFVEDYGKGGYDPFERETEYEAVSSTWENKGTKLVVQMQEKIEEEKKPEKTPKQAMQEGTLAYERWENPRTGKKICIMDYAMGQEVIQIFQTEDGGESWKYVLETENQALWVHYDSKFWFYNAQVGFIYDPGRAGAMDSKASVLQTNDGGKNFVEIALSKDKREIYFDGLPYEENGRLILDAHYYQRNEKKEIQYQSIDNGATWKRKN